MVNKQLETTLARGSGLSPVYDESGKIIGYTDKDGKFQKANEGTTASQAQQLVGLGAAAVPGVAAGSVAARGARVATAGKKGRQSVTTSTGLKTKGMELKIEKEVAKWEKSVADINNKKYKTTGDLDIRIGNKGGVGVSQKFKVNAKNMGTMERIGQAMWGSAGRKMTTLVGTSVGSIVLSLWARGEAIESLGIFIDNRAAKRGEFTGDWSSYFEAQQVREEIINQTTTEKIMNFVPVAGAIQNIGDKITALTEVSKLSEDMAIRTQQDQLIKAGITPNLTDPLQNLIIPAGGINALTDEEKLIQDAQAQRAEESLLRKELAQEDIDTEIMMRDPETGELVPSGKSRRDAMMLEQAAQKQREDNERNAKSFPAPRKGKGAAPLPGAGQSIRKAPEERKKIGGLL